MNGKPHWLGWVVLVAILAAIAVRASSPIVRTGGDLTRYIEVGELVLRGEDIYATSNPTTNTWPPLFALMAAPLAILARLNVHVTRALWATVMLLSLAGSLQLSIRLVYRKPLVVRYRAGAISVASAAAVIPTLLALRAILPNFRFLQVNTLVLLLALAGCYLIARSRPGAGGAILGAAAAIKIIPIFFVPYLIWKRWWRALGAMLVSGAALTILPIVFFGFDRWWSYVSRFLGGSASSTFIATGSQSLYTMFHRILVLPNWWNTEFIRPYRVAMDIGAVIAVLLAFVVFAAVFIVVSRHRGVRPSSPAVVTEFAIVLGASFLFLPFAWRHYFVFLLPAYVVLWRAAMAGTGNARVDPFSLDHGQRRRIRWLLGLGVLLQVGLSSSLLGAGPATVLKNNSGVTVSALLILTALAYLRWLLGQHPATDSLTVPGHPPQSSVSSVTTSQ